MKRIALVLAAAAAAFALSSCDKESTVINGEKLDSNPDMVLDITVSDLDGTPDGVETKVMKKGWATNDRIFIWYDGNQQERPDLVIKRTVTYSGARPYYYWSIDTEAAVSGNIPGANGTLKCLFIGGNELSAYEYKTTQAPGAALRAWFEGQPELTFTSDPNSPISYTYSSKTIKFDISAWKPCSELQVVISGISASSASNYRLKAENLLGMDGFYIRADRITAHGNTAGQYVEGVSNSDGAAFYFSGTVNPSVKQDYVFYLENKITGELETYTVKERTHSTKGFEALKISHSKFFGTLETTGTAKRNGDIEVNWVQLWENGPKFAEYNVGVGVIDGKAESYGGYYSWGSRENKDQSGAYNNGTDALTGTDDTATKLWGENWRMPTKDEFQALLDNCDVEWTTVNGVKGRKFTGKGDYASNSVFLPAAGYCYLGDVSDQGISGSYWSSTPGFSYHAYFLYFFSSYQSVTNEYRVTGRSVRAVLAE